MVPHHHFSYDTVLKNLQCERPKTTQPRRMIMLIIQGDLEKLEKKDNIK
jgi:hypothetical protein